MLNYIATGITAYLLTNYLRAKNEAGDLVTKTRPLPSSSFIPPLNRLFRLFGFHLPAGTQLNGFLIGAILLGIGFYVLVWRTRFGFDLRASGANPPAARAVGRQPEGHDREDDADQRRSSPGCWPSARCSATLSSTATPSSSRRSSASPASRSRSSVATIRRHRARRAAVRLHRACDAGPRPAADPAGDLQDHAGLHHPVGGDRLRDRASGSSRGRGA